MSRFAHGLSPSKTAECMASPRTSCTSTSLCIAASPRNDRGGIVRVPRPRFPVILRIKSAPISQGIQANFGKPPWPASCGPHDHRRNVLARKLSGAAYFFLSPVATSKQNGYPLHAPAARSRPTKAAAKFLLCAGKPGADKGDGVTRTLPSPGFLSSRYFLVTVVPHFLLLIVN
jgi:hypothetical protein